MTTLRPVTWQPILGAGGVLIGIALDYSFAQACDNVPITALLRNRTARFVWARCKPADWSYSYVPDHIIDFDGTLLPKTLQRYHDMGKWLNREHIHWSTYDSGEPVFYNFHHAGSPVDNAANQWLQFAFSYWVRFAHLELQRRGSPYLDVL